MERLIRVNILGTEYVLKSDEPDELCEKVARFVREKFEDISKDAKGLPEKKLAVLVAFNIAEEYFKLLEETELTAFRVSKRVREITQQIDRAITKGKS
ncbi:MAG: cell division protein ZapA [Desulfatiglandales bacterium]